jgi:hypothetical protein
METRRRDGGSEEENDRTAANFPIFPYTGLTVLPTDGERPASYP